MPGDLVRHSACHWMVENEVIEGAHLFLGAHSAYLTEGFVPDHVLEATRHYKLS